MPSKQHGPTPGQGVETVLKAVRGLRDRFLTWRRSRLGWRGALLYLLSAPLALAGVIALAQGELAAALTTAGAFALISVGATLNRRGLLEELVSRQRRYTHSRVLPYKYLGAACVAAGTVLAAHGPVGQDLGVSLVYGLLAVTGLHLVYGLPRPGQLLATATQRDVDPGLRKTLQEAESRLFNIEKAALRLGNPELERRLLHIAGQGRAVLEQIAAHPEERYRARKFLNVYLEGAEQVASRYARTHRLARGAELEQNFRNVLTEIQSVFDRQLNRLAEEDLFDVDVRIEVLRKQLRQEGIT